ncbi:phenylacetic acid degradation protein paaI [Paenibacillus sp. JCM 10914]|nr:hypothetical protein [Paenibacillus sp. JCM 10914]GAE10019.1 phenylacetic acid degradation protein paaI [Paenibacillus sp. JCM 10914]
MHQTNSSHDTKAGQPEFDKEAYMEAMAKAAEPTFWGYLAASLRQPARRRLLSPWMHSPTI